MVLLIICLLFCLYALLVNLQFRVFYNPNPSFKYQEGFNDCRDMSLRQKRFFEKLPFVEAKLMRGEFEEKTNSVDFPEHTWLKLEIFGLFSIPWESTILMIYNPCWSVGYGRIINVREIDEEEIWYDPAKNEPLIN